MMTIEGLDEEKVTELVRSRMPANITDEKQVRLWSLKLRNEIIREFKDSGRLSELMLKSALEKAKKPKQSKQSKEPKQTSRRSDVVTIHSLPKGVMDVISKMFPGASSNTDAVMAMAYVFSGGACEISEKAMVLVRANPKGVKISASAAQYDEIIKLLKQQNKTLERQNRKLTAIELCDIYDVYQRIYGAKEIDYASPRRTEFREKGCLDMLARLREQAIDQYDDDAEARGREIYDLMKDRKD